MTKMYIILMLLTLMLKFNGFSQTNQIPKDSIVKNFLKGNLIIINDWALFGPTIFFDSKILKYINPENQLFYFINGVPCWNYSNALNLIINLKITKIQEIGPNQATAIWGQKDSKNGALLINTEKKTKYNFK